MNLKLFVCLIIILTLFLLSCAPKISHVIPSLGELPKPTSIADTKADRKEVWEKTLYLARKEGKVTVFSSAGGEVPKIVSRSFQDRLGIQLEWLTMQGGQSATRIKQERAAGIYAVDILIGGSSPWINVLKPIGALESLEPVLILSEVKDPNVWWSSKLYFNDRDKTIMPFLAYNVPPIGFNNMVRPEEIKSFSDLLNSKWKGKIVRMESIIFLPVMASWL